MLSGSSKLFPQMCALVPSHAHQQSASPPSLSVAAPSVPSFPHRLRPPRSDMDCPEAKKGEVAVVACPPDDSLVEIFSRLPAKPLFRFKCVSKDWCGLIADRLRCRKFPQTLEGFLVGDGVESYGGFIDVSERPVPLVDPCFSFLKEELPEIEKIILLDSCNGLVLFEHGRLVADSNFADNDSDDEDILCFESLGYIVCNPVTKEWVSVPSPIYTQGRCYSDRTYLIFDPAISPHFQLIHLGFGGLYLYAYSSLVEVHTFSSVTGAWRQELEGAPSHTTVGICDECRFDGMLHVGARQPQLPSQNQPHLPSEDKHMILAVGEEGRPFRTLHWPQNDRGDIYFVGQSLGYLHCVSGFETQDSHQMTELSIWVLEDYDAQKWVLRNNVSFAQLFERTSGCINDWSVVGIHPDRGLVFFAEYWNRKLISYDMDKKEVHDVCSLHGYRSPIIPYVPYFAQSAVFAKKS